MGSFYITFTIYAIISASLVFTVAVLIRFFLPMTKGAPYVVSDPERRKTMLELLHIQRGERVADLGSGDGTLVILYAQNGADVSGYELNPLLVWRSRKKISQEHLTKHARIYWKSFWQQDLSQFDAISVYGIGYIMKDLEKKLLKEAKKGTRVISNFYQFPTLKPVRSKKDVHLYIIT